MKIKNEIISKATATTPFLLSIATTEQIINNTLLILGAISSIISIIYTAFIIIKSIKEKTFKLQDLEILKEKYNKELEKWIDKKKKIK